MVVWATGRGVSKLSPTFWQILLISLVIYFGCAESSLLCTLLSSCLERGQSLDVVHGLLIVVASLGAEHGLSGVQASVAEACGLGGCGSPALEHVLNGCGSPALEHVLSSCGGRLSCSEACGIFLDQGLNSCLLHYQADSLSLSHQGSPINPF